MIKIIGGKIYKEVCLEDLDKKELLEYIRLRDGSERETTTTRPIVDEERSNIQKEKKRKEHAIDELRACKSSGVLTTNILKSIAEKYGYNWRYLYDLMNREL